MRLNIRLIHQQVIYQLKNKQHPLLLQLGTLRVKTLMKKIQQMITQVTFPVNSKMRMQTTTQIQLLMMKKNMIPILLYLLLTILVHIIIGCFYFSLSIIYIITFSYYKVLY